jgi:hypothetical protein
MMDNERIQQQQQTTDNSNSRTDSQANSSSRTRDQAARYNNATLVQLMVGVDGRWVEEVTKRMKRGEEGFAMCRAMAGLQPLIAQWRAYWPTQR